MNNQYKKYGSMYKCPICGKIDCHIYGSGKKLKKLVRKMTRTILKREVEDE